MIGSRMMNSQKKRSLRPLGCFLAVLLALTFFSRTLYLATLPHVAAVRISGGYLSVDFSSDAPLLRAETVRELVPCGEALENPLPVKSVFVRENQAVEAGEPLLEFDAHWGENALSRAQVECDAAQASLLSWQSDYEEALRALDANDPAQAAKRRLLEQEKALGGVSQSEVSARLLSAQRTLEALRRLSEDGWQLLAPEKLWVSDLFLEAGDQWKGVTPALEYLPQAQAVYAGVRAERRLAENAARVTVYGSDGKPSAAWKYAGASIDGDECTLWATLEEGAEPELPQGGLSFRLETGYYDALVPRAALCGNSIYLVRQRTGSWGQSEEYACRVEGRCLLSDEQYALFEADLSLAGEYVLIDWDRAFEEGDTLYVSGQ